jgi:hypothetical protein
MMAAAAATAATKGARKRDFDLLALVWTVMVGFLSCRKLYGLRRFGPAGPHQSR